MSSNQAAHEVASYFSCLNMGFASEVFVEHGETWARYAREAHRPQLAAEIEKKTAVARRECQRPKSLETSVSATPLPAPRAAPTADEIDAGWSDVVTKAGPARATPKPAAPTPAAGSARWPSAAESDRVWSEIVAKINAEAGTRTRTARAGLNEPK